MRPIRAKLEKTAGQLYSTAIRAKKSGNKKKARKLLANIKRMVPKSSSWYKKANSSLRTLR